MTQPIHLPSNYHKSRTAALLWKGFFMHPYQRPLIDTRRCRNTKKKMDRILACQCEWKKNKVHHLLSLQQRSQSKFTDEWTHPLGWKFTNLSQNHIRPVTNLEKKTSKKDSDKSKVEVKPNEETFRNVDHKTLKKLYTGRVRPILEYPIPLMRVKIHYYIIVSNAFWMKNVILSMSETGLIGASGQEWVKAW